MIFMKDLLIQQEASMERSLPMAEKLLIIDSIRDNPQHHRSLFVRDLKCEAVAVATCNCT
jgi:hypothetical protein